MQQFRQQQNGYAAPAAPVPPVQQAPAAKFCTSCGSQVDPNAAFCNNCGNKLQ
ncbi:MAG: zinc ribbon domain-containing protein [Clostridia bacterium]|nr:zinc ribbon domain-containing protein [Clostridia bacterium]